MPKHRSMTSKRRRHYDQVLQVSGRPDALRYAEAEYALLHETESWARPAGGAGAPNMSVGNLRRFCENSHPPLSSQAMMSLARFSAMHSIRTSHAEVDFVMTRLFSRDDGDEKRRLLFNRERDGRAHPDAVCRLDQRVVLLRR